jgi:hypothetical protein
MANEWLLSFDASTFGMAPFSTLSTHDPVFFWWILVKFLAINASITYFLQWLPLSYSSLLGGFLFMGYSPLGGFLS